MNKNKKLWFISLAALLFFVSSCETWLDVNENPNNPTDAPITGLLTNTILETTLNVQRAGNITSPYVQHLASPNPAASSDIMEPLDFSGTWSSFYNVMSDLTDLMDKADRLGASHYLAAGQTLMALNLGMVVDMWGPVPYSEGFRFTTVTPKYDNDQELYAEIIALLDDAIANFNKTSAVTIRADDFIFGGNIPRWIRFANSLKARYLVHTPGYDRATLQAAVAAGFQSNADDAKMDFFSQRFNPWAQVAINNQNLLLGGWISSQFIEALDGTSYPIFDPRLPLMVGKTDAGGVCGSAKWGRKGNAPERGARSTLIPEQFYTRRLGPVLIMTFSELKFIEAEASFGSDKAKAYEAYLDGIRAHMLMLGVAAGEIQAYLDHPSVSVGVENFSIADVFKEKWIATFLHPETWNDARRFDYAYKDMTIPDNLNPDLGGQFIRRLQYPDSEISRNGKNVPSVGLLDRIWWDR